MVCGCDIGSLTSKAVVLHGRRVVARSIIKSTADPARSAQTVTEHVLAAAGLQRGDVATFIATGYGRDTVPFADTTISEIACHGRGARFMLPSARTVIDIGGQDCKVIRLDRQGAVSRFVANDKCASGTGRFLEVMARVLGVAIEDLGAMSARARAAVTLASACTVWAQADVIRHLSDGVPPEEIAAGINAAMATRTVTLLNSVQPEADVCMTGGVAKNTGVFTAIERQAGIRLKRLRRHDPQLAGAIGAALFAAEQAGESS
jgi:predicted CoA-substrate-specific enzyme activase